MFLLRFRARCRPFRPLEPDVRAQALFSRLCNFLHRSAGRALLPMPAATSVSPTVLTFISKRQPCLPCGHPQDENAASSEGELLDFAKAAFINVSDSRFVDEESEARIKAIVEVHPGFFSAPLLT